jgi:hypothetical protein
MHSPQRFAIQHKPFGSSKVPRDSGHHRPRIARHEVNIVDSCSLIAESGFEREDRLFPLGIE